MTASTVLPYGQYEQSVFNLLQSAFGSGWVRDDSRIFALGPDAGTGEVDGVLDHRVAVEVGAGCQKQVRACVLDLALHPLQGKLLVLVDTPGHASDRTVVQEAVILSRLGCSGIVFRMAGGMGVSEDGKRLGTIVDEFEKESGWQTAEVWATSGNELIKLSPLPAHQPNLHITE